jgi:putative NADH-flavin reductase
MHSEALYAMLSTTHRLLGSEVTYQAIARGEDVVALCRTPSKLTVPAGSGGSKAGEPLQDSKITVIQGSATNQADVDKVFATGGVTGVVVALGGKSKDVGATMLTDATTCIIKGKVTQINEKRAFPNLKRFAPSCRCSNCLLLL